MPMIVGVNALDLLDWLEQWYRSQCNGEWEHEHGIVLQTLDNPGWLLKVDLVGTTHAKLATDRSLEVVGDPPGESNQNIGGDEWMSCEIKEGRFVGAGDPSRLTDILMSFRRFVEATTETIHDRFPVEST